MFDTVDPTASETDQLLDKINALNKLGWALTQDMTLDEIVEYVLDPHSPLPEDMTHRGSS